MRVSDRGLELIASFEGFVDHAYKPVPTEQFWTIGYGHYGPDVTAGQRITQAKALALLRRDVSSFEQAVERLVTVPLNQNQFDALVSFTLNTGTGALAESTLLRRVNAREYSAVPAELGRWVKSGTQTLPGLVRRRAAEAALFTRPVRATRDRRALRRLRQAIRRLRARAARLAARIKRKEHR